MSSGESRKYIRGPLATTLLPQPAPELGGLSHEPFALGDLNQKTHRIGTPASKPAPRTRGTAPASPSFRFRPCRLRLRGSARLGREAVGPCGPPRRRTWTATMALPGPLNRYLLLMAQEHLEFRLPVSPQRPPQLLAGEDGALGVAVQV